MFIGHFGVGFAAKSVNRRPSLGTYFFAAQFVDLIWPTLLLLGIERVEITPGITTVTPLDFVHYPITHSLVMAIAWGAVFGLVYWLRRKDRSSAIFLGACVVSHWVLDLIVHRPDLPLYPGDVHPLGFGLWNSLAATLIVEGLIFVIGVALYARATTANDRTGQYGFWGLIVFFVVVHATNIFGPPPPNVMAIAWAGQLQWLIVLWAYWIDRHRTARQ